MRVPLRVTAIRFSLFAATILGVTYAFKISQGLSWRQNWPDWILLVLIAPLPFARRVLALTEAQCKVVLLSAIVIPNALTFGAFNPVQPAAPIFRALPEPLAEALRDSRLYDKEGDFVYPLSMGAVANGLGLPSIAHVQLRPELRMFRRYFPSLSDPEYDVLFNRYAHVSLRRDGPPVLVQTDLIRLPASAFGVQLPTLQVRQDAMPSWASYAAAPLDGHLDDVSFDERGATMKGWALMENRADNPASVVVHTDRPIQVDRTDALIRSDVVIGRRDKRLGLSGFEIQISWPRDGRPTRLCLRSEDSTFDVHRVQTVDADGCLSVPPDRSRR